MTEEVTLEQIEQANNMRKLWFEQENTKLEDRKKQLKKESKKLREEKVALRIQERSFLKSIGEGAVKKKREKKEKKEEKQ